MPKFPYKWRAFSIEAYYHITSIMTVMGVAIMVPAMAEEFDADLATAAWVVLAFNLGMGCFFLVSGHLGDRFGRKWIAGWGAALETPVLVAFFFLNNIYAIIAFRFFQSILRSMVPTNLTATTVSAFGSEQRGRLLGLNTAVLGIAMLIAMPVAGFVTDTWGWRWVFLGFAPLSALASLMIFTLLEDNRAVEDRNVSFKVREFDVPGIMVLLLATGATVYGIQVFTKAGTMGVGVAIALAGVALFALLLWMERRTSTPIIPMALFRLRRYTIATVQAMAFAVSNGAVLLVVPVFLVVGLGWSAVEAGVMFTVLNASRAVAGPVSGWVTDRVSERGAIVAAMGTTTVGMAMFVIMPTAPATWFVGLPLVLLGVGGGLFQPPNMKQVYGVVPQSQFGRAQGMISLSRSLAQVGGGAIAVAVLVMIAPSAAPPGPDPDLVDAFRVAMVVIIGLFAAGLALGRVAVRFATLEALEARAGAAPDEPPASRARGRNAPPAVQGEAATSDD